MVEQGRTDQTSDRKFRDIFGLMAADARSSFSGIFLDRRAKVGDGWMMDDRAVAYLSSTYVLHPLSRSNQSLRTGTAAVEF